MSEGWTEEKELDGIQYRVSTKSRPRGFLAYWTCYSCNKGEAWGPFKSREEAQGIAQIEMLKHHSEKHSAVAP
jgi:hypothetical protein